jgi:hypothetical protein
MLFSCSDGSQNNFVFGKIAFLDYDRCCSCFFFCVVFIARKCDQVDSKEELLSAAAASTAPVRSSLFAFFLHLRLALLLLLEFVSPASFLIVSSLFDDLSLQSHLFTCACFAILALSSDAAFASSSPPLQSLRLTQTPSQKFENIHHSAPS